MKLPTNKGKNLTIFFWTLCLCHVCSFILSMSGYVEALDLSDRGLSMKIVFSTTASCLHCHFPKGAISEKIVRSFLEIFSNL